MSKALFLFQDLARSNLSNARYVKYLNWVKTADQVRQGSLGTLTVAQANQYDKTEELITWNTFAPLLRMEKTTRDKTVSEIIREGLSKDVDEYHDAKGFGLQFEYTIPSPRLYLEHLRQFVRDHPVKYVRDEARDKEILEGNTHVDLALMNSKLLVLVEVKFMSDIQSDVRYDHVRNQLARLIDAGIDASDGRKLGVLLVSPEWGYKSRNRLYCYKLDDYRESMENVRTDIPHRSLTEIANALLGVGWVSLEFAASTIHRKAKELGLLSKEDAQQVQGFYKERRIDMTL
jgi:hypothetical protein